MTSEQTLTQVVVELAGDSYFERILALQTGGEPGSAERLWASRVGTNLYEVRSIPCAARGLAYGDIVECRRGSDGREYVARVVEPRGHSTLWLVPRKSCPPAAATGLLTTLAGLDVGYEQADPRYYALDLPPTTDRQAVMEHLAVQHQDGHIMFAWSDAATAPEPNNRHPGAQWLGMADVAIYVDLTEHELEGSWEQVPCKMIDEDRFQVCCIPFFTYNLALGDIVTAGAAGDNFPTFQKVIERSGYWTIRVSFVDTDPDLRPAVLSDTIQWLTGKGCAFEWESHEYVAVNVLTEQLTDEIAEYLWGRMNEGVLTYEVGQEDTSGQ